MRSMNLINENKIIEKQKEIDLILSFVNKLSDKNVGIIKVLKLQSENPYEDDGDSDGIISIDGSDYHIEARRKGYPNHCGKTCKFYKGWNSFILKDGIFINERTIRKHERTGFLFLVDIFNFEIKRSEVKVAIINKDKINKLLSQPRKYQKSTNSGVSQSVKLIPIVWFKKF